MRSSDDPQASLVKNTCICVCNHVSHIASNLINENHARNHAICTRFSDLDSDSRLGESPNTKIYKQFQITIVASHRFVFNYSNSITCAGNPKFMAEVNGEHNGTDQSHESP
jgi:hypothetical protein